MSFIVGGALAANQTYQRQCKMPNKVIGCVIKAYKTIQ